MTICLIRQIQSFSAKHFAEMEVWQMTICLLIVIEKSSLKRNIWHKKLAKTIKMIICLLRQSQSFSTKHFGEMEVWQMTIFLLIATQKCLLRETFGTKKIWQKQKSGERVFAYSHKNKV